MNNWIEYESKDLNSVYAEAKRFFEREDYDEVYIDCTAYNSLKLKISRFDIETYDKISSAEVQLFAFALFVNYQACLNFDKPMDLANIIESLYDEIAENGTAISLFNSDSLSN